MCLIAVALPVLAGAVLSLLMGGAPAQVRVIVADEHELQLARAYRRVVGKYRQGDADAVDAVLAIPRLHLESIMKVIFSEMASEIPWTAGELRGAAMLHTDAALRIVGPDEEDGERRHHVNVAGRMLHASGTPADPFVPRWYYAVSRALRDRHFFGVAEDLLDRGRSQVPGNPTILFESASVAETLARGYAVGVPERGAIPSLQPGRYVDLVGHLWDTAGNLQRRAARLNDAAKWLREAVDRDGTMLIARLHLGRVETLRSREKDGLVHLERVFNGATDDATAYLAALFSGAAHERLRRPDAAAASYRQAIARFPAGQAAYLALSEILQSSGKTDESRAVLQSLLDGKAGLIREPWWWYLVDPPGLAEERLAGLRREVRP
jgi:tetratricopeptide (TPR) repeat protein